MKKSRRRGKATPPAIVFEKEANVADDVIAGDQINNTQVSGDQINNTTIINMGITPPVPAKVAIPNLAFYKMNRVPQEDAFGELLAQYKPEAPLPILAIIHGDDDQAVDTFLTRLREDVIPNKLKKASRTKAEWEYIPVHELVAYKDVADFQEKIRELLAKKLGDENGTADIKKMQESLSRRKCPVIVELLLGEELILKSKADVLKATLDFWRKWTLSSKGQFLFVFIYLIYEKKSINSLGSLFDALLGKDSKGDVVARLRQLSFNEDNNIRIIGGVLPELENVPIEETRVWADYFYRQFRSGDIEEFKEFIKTVYAGERSKPLYVVAKELKQFHQKIAPDQEIMI